MTKEYLKKNYDLVKNWRILAIEVFEKGTSTLLGYIRASDLEQNEVNIISPQQMEQEKEDYEDRCGKMVGTIKDGYILVKN